MENRIITFEANQQCLRKTGGPNVFATKTVSYVEAHFDLGENWTGFDSIEAVWWNDFVKPIPAVLDTEGICEVPHEVLTMKGEIYVNLVGSIAEGDVLTARLTTAPITAFCNKFNAQLGEGTTTPLTPSEYEQFVASVKADADRAEDAKDSARVYAGNALSSAQNALASETNASTSEDNAKVSELNAEAYKNQAQLSAESASASAENAERSAENAENAKDEAIGARDEIRNMSATATTLPAGSDATASYSDGVLSLGIPKGDKGDRGQQGIQGETGATPNFAIGTVETLEPTEDATATITGTAENPVLNLGIPQGEVGEVSYADLKTLLPMDTASGAIVSLPDGQSIIPVDSLKVSLEPIQDLHGYDKPWSGGAGVNLVDSSILRNGNYNKYNIPNTLKNGQTYTYSVYGDDTYYYRLMAGHTNEENPQPNIPVSNSYLKAGSRDTFVAPNDIEDYEYLFLGGSASGAGSANIQIQVEKGDVANPTYHPYSNICPISGHTEVDTHRTGVNVWDEEWEVGTYDSAVDTVQKYNSDTTHIRSKNPIEVKPNSTYYMNSASKNVHLIVADAEGNVLYRSVSLNNGTFTTPTNGVFVYFNMAASYGTTYNNDISINYPSTDTEYHAYQGTTYTTALGQTVYGGTLDVVSGKLTVDRAMVDLGSLEYDYDSTVPRFYSFGINTLVKAPANNAVVNAISSDYIATSFDNLYVTDQRNGTFAAGATGTLSIINTSYTDATAFKTAMNGVQLCYELAEPQTYQLTPTEIALLKGQNNVWTDSGEVEVTYKADVGLYIDKKLSSNGTRSLSMGLTKSATAEAENEAEPSNTEAETKTEETKTEPSKTETETEAVEAKTETDKSETR